MDRTDETVKSELGPGTVTRPVSQTISHAIPRSREAAQNCAEMQSTLHHNFAIGRRLLHREKIVRPSSK